MAIRLVPRLQRQLLLSQPPPPQAPIPLVLLPPPRLLEPIHLAHPLLHRPPSNQPFRLRVVIRLVPRLQRQLLLSQPPPPQAPIPLVLLPPPRLLEPIHLAHPLLHRPPSNQPFRLRVAIRLVPQLQHQLLLSQPPPPLALPHLVE